MGSQDLALKVVLKAQDLASGTVKGFGASLGSLPGPAMTAASAILAVGTAIIGAAAQAAKMAADYQQQFNSIQALTGSNAQQMAFYDAQVKKLAIDAGEAPTKLAAGLYNVLSASYQGADAMKILTLATEDAKIGLTDAATTSNALTNILRTFGTATKDATRVNGELLETVTLGKSTFAQYASTITKAASSSKQFGVSMETMNAAWSTLTSTGISAGQATTDYTQLLSVMYANIGTVTKSLEKNGIAFNETKFNAMSFGDKVKYLNQVLQQATDKHVHITGVTKQAAQAIQAISGHIQNYNSNLAQLSNKQAMANKTQQAWAITQSGFNQTMSRVQAAVQVLFINIGQQLLPVLTKAAQFVLPIIQNFTNWLIKSGALRNGLNLLGNGVRGLAGFIGGLVTGIGNLIGWFQKNQLAALALLIPLGMLGAVLVNIAVGAIVSFIAGVPALVAGFIAWATAAWAAAAGTIAATWPILLIGAAIGVLIAIIILLWTHWSQVTQWLQNAWKITVMGISAGLKSLGQFFASVWQHIVSSLQGFWNTIVSVVQAGLSFLVGIFTAPFRAIGMLFQWLYSHNKYFALMIDTIRKWVAAGLTWLHDRWQQAITWLAGLWNGLKDKASQAWNNVKQAVINAVLALGEWEIAQWNKATKWLSDKWNSYKDLMGKAWQMVSGLLSGVWNTYVSKPLQNLWNSIVNFVNGWPKQLYQSGINMIQSLINGMLSMIGQAGQAASNIMKNIAQFLGFHSPAAEGEGRYIIQWGSNMLKGFSSGVLEAIPQLQASVALAVKQGTALMSGSPALVSVPYGRPPVSSSTSSYNAGSYTHNGNIVIHATPGMNTKDLAKEVENQLSRKFRRSGTMGNPTGGVRNS